MCRSQKEAMFNLVVVALALAVVLTLYPFLGQRAAAGFAVLAFLAFGPLFYRRRRGQVVADERDELIRRRSTIAAYSIFWVAWVAAAMLALAVYGSEGAVPVTVVTSAVWFGMMLFVVSHAIATLAQYGREDANARS
jgi:lysylphosphatidylglycerol synthetase-like protein (DUF2156 family)